ncbi:hypothetical protein [Rhodohalobacter mucosus]|uniref:Coiled coil domain-containing protein n=1 Tax=Rhodohalobacter mucosus TaxID=2079485 RepID=A0A316TS80_9BACT|nr:hypothetical protein [Rhodohalobacter mucosus]PWN06491.1 hypothetical protein DDZ15_08185 [Rhodohalobacter mucosus]
MNREQYIDNMAAKLKEWNAEVEKLEAKAQRAGTDAKKEISKEIQELRTKKNVAQDKLDDVKEAGEDAWKELQTEAEDAFEDIKSALDNAVNRFEDI